MSDDGGGAIGGDDDLLDHQDDEDEYLGHEKYGDPLVVSVVQDALVRLLSRAVALQHYNHHHHQISNHHHHHDPGHDHRYHVLMGKIEVSIHPAVGVEHILVTKIFGPVVVVDRLKIIVNISLCVEQCIEHVFFTKVLIPIVQIFLIMPTIVTL